MTDEETVAPYQASGMRPKLAFGCDRMLASLIVTGAILIGFLWMQVWAYLVAILIAALGIPLLRKMGRHDPLLVKVFLRSLSYRKFYGATRKEVGRSKRAGSQWVKAGAH